MVDRCIHRQMPLSLGRLKGDQIECGYHGLTYGSDGVCTRIPGASTVPERVRVQTFPVHEKDGLVWMWPGDPDAADVSLLPDHHWYTDPGWTTVAETAHMNARAQLLNENLLDLSHLSFLHLDSIGSAEIAEIPITTEFDERHVTVRRVMHDITCAPFFERITGIAGNIDRLQSAEYTAPAFHITTATLKAHGDPAAPYPFQQRTMHAITPETRTSAHYFWAISRNFALQDDEVTEHVLTGARGVFVQDIEACEAIEHIIAAWEPSYPLELNIKVDGAPLQSRRILERMIASEQKSDEGSQWSSSSDTAARAAARAWSERAAIRDRNSVV
jgi:phenylpropionate dioxygenase-like ring-hydroxylating dioxygenase large terminal subunit